MKSTLVFCGNGIEKAPFDNYFIVIRYIGEGGIANLMENQIEKLLNRYPVLESCSAAIEKTVEELTGFLRQAGFLGIKVYGDKKMRAPRPGEQRVFFVARKDKRSKINGR